MTRSRGFLPVGLAFTSLALSGCLCFFSRASAGEEAAPQTPSGVSVNSGGIREAVLAWSVEGLPKGAVRIERSTRETGPFCKVGVADAKQGRFADSGTLHDSTAYYYRLVATSPCAKESRPSSVVRTLTAPPPDPPSELAAAIIGRRTVRLTWKASASEGVLRYRVERAVAAQPEAWSPRGHVAHCQFEEGDQRNDGLLDGTEYRYRVVSVNRAGAAGQPSAAVSVTVPPLQPM